MAKADIILPNGTRINIDGTPEEIIKIKESLTNEESIQGKRKNVVKKNNSKKKLSKNGPLIRIRGLIEKDFFKEKRTIENVRKMLEEMAIFYKVSDISPSLIRLVKKGELRRIKEEGQWRYVNS
jgi:hypothetical protein